MATDTESGTLSYADPQTVFNRLSGTITWLPGVGSVIHPGQTLYDVDNQPVTLMNGSTPAFRDLSAADSAGPDILELNRALHSLGFDASEPITLSDTWQAATTDAVERWQGSRGQSQTGTITLGQVVFLPGPQRITGIDTTLGSTGGSGGGANAASSQGASTTVAARPEFVSLTTTTTTTGATGPTGPTGPIKPGRGQAGPGGSTAAQVAELKALTALLKAELQELRSARSSSAGGASRGLSAAATGRSASGASTSRGGGGSGSSSSGLAASGAGASSSGGGSAQAIMQTSSTQLVVTVDLDASKQSEAIVGEPVTVEMPNGDTVDGKITGVSPVAQSSSGSASSSGSGGSGGGGSSSGGSGGSSSSSSATVPVTVTLPGRQNTVGLDQAAVSVNFEQQVEDNVLSVPVTALLATQGGGYAIQEAAAPHRLLPVTPGLFAAGYVQISGSDIYPGLQVTDSQG
ncbi:MAG: hypothetical protein JO244_05515 [Solirubrobacterales bacterium]|nr:hypothetical protein [Solirubrobacterales bacterium]